MSPSRSSNSLSLASLLTLSSLIPASWGMDCADILTNGVHFNLKELGGPHVVHWSETYPELGQTYNYNFTLDICNKLKWHKDGNKNTECTHGTWVCGMREEVDLSGINNNTVVTPIDIAGSYKSTGNGRTLDEKFTRLKDSKSNADSAKEGVRIELNGGRFPHEEKNGLDQRAIIEFVCDPERTGLEGEEKDDGEKEDSSEDSKRLTRRDGECEDSDKSLRFCGYKKETPKDKGVRTLRLEWRTKHACEKNAPPDSGSHWGFFTWFIIIFFLATAAYLIFGSWLNYNRYGARGWDLLPHGDTLRDIPYILKDFGRKVLNSTQGGGSRGGYSAV
ncbi:hypothetical protein DM02DRAFT_628775 [Periconia macrospinosa]|uniref:Autophagy-related protein 27 n=1 Tax=Periconia macrospinosa TaxID=97972 RepID=A0A2V1DPH4_9PLEO|nr:hypothetical protein DM02DRAFT_628775 [Periconia macrospinosa]